LRKKGQKRKLILIETAPRGLWKETPNLFKTNLPFARRKIMTESESRNGRKKNLEASVASRLDGKQKIWDDGEKCPT